MPAPSDPAEDLLAHCRRTGRSISEIVLENEKTWRTPEEIRTRLGRADPR